jgi:hypothetical protein
MSNDLLLLLYVFWQSQINVGVFNSIFVKQTLVTNEGGKVKELNEGNVIVAR